MAFGVYVCIICMHQKREALINYILRIERERENILIMKSQTYTLYLLILCQLDTSWSLK